MSKSRGTVVRPLDLAPTYGLDAFRYFLLREMVFGLDANFSEEPWSSASTRTSPTIWVTSSAALWP